MKTFILLTLLLIGASFAFANTTGADKSPPINDLTIQSHDLNLNVAEPLVIENVYSAIEWIEPGTFNMFVESAPVIENAQFVETPDNGLRLCTGMLNDLRFRQCDQPERFSNYPFVTMKTCSGSKQGSLKISPITQGGI